MSLLSELVLLLPLLLPLLDALRLPLELKPELVWPLDEPASIPPSFDGGVPTLLSPCVLRSRLVFEPDELEESDELDESGVPTPEPDLLMELSLVDGSPCTLSAFCPLVFVF